MVKRDIIKINEKKCNGCGQCVPNCPEGAIQIIDGKARLVSDLFCDGLGACIGHCPTNAIKIEKREAEPYDEEKTIENIIPHGENTIRAHLEHLEEHGESEFLMQAVKVLRRKGIKIKKRQKSGIQETSEEPEPSIEEPEEVSPKESSACGCLGTQVQDLVKTNNQKKKSKSKGVKINSELEQWPVQLSLLPPQASFFDNSDLLVSADCVPFAYANFHQDLLNGKKLVIGCPKLDDVGEYEEKLTEILKHNKIKSVTVAIMEVPCCYGLKSAVESALEKSGKKIPLKVEVISVGGEK